MSDYHFYLCMLLLTRLVDSITLHFKKSNGEIETVEANEGDDIVDVSWEWDLDIEGELSLQVSSCRRALSGDAQCEYRADRSLPSESWPTAACEKSIACSTCHVILEDDIYDKLEEPSDDEVGTDALRRRRTTAGFNERR